MADAAEQSKKETIEKPVDGSLHASVPSRPSLPVTPQIAKMLETVPDPDMKAMLSIALSRTTFGFGPDPETAKIIAESEMHEESCRLKGYQSSLENRDKQNQRDHEYRNKRLNHQSLMSSAVLVVSIGGIGFGLYLSVSGNPSVGNPVIVAGLMLLSTLSGKLLASKDKD